MLLHSKLILLSLAPNPIQCSGEVTKILQPPTKKNGKVTALKSKAQELGFAFKSGNLTILLYQWL